MEEWELFYERGKKDITLSQSLFEENCDYEMSAKVAQQALEKFLKAYLLKLKIIKNPKIRTLFTAWYNDYNFRLFIMIYSMILY